MLTRIVVIALSLVLTAGSSGVRTDVVLDWNAIMATTVAAQNPFAQTRLAAITQLAVFEAVNACTERYQPYLGTVTAPAGASAEAAATAAAHGILKHYFAGSAAALDTARGQSLAAIADGAAKMNGIAVGEAAAAALIAARLDDGAAPPETFLPTTSAPACGSRRRQRSRQEFCSTGSASRRLALDAAINFDRSRRRTCPAAAMRGTTTRS
jgi:hypothetical protein